MEMWFKELSQQIAYWEEENTVFLWLLLIITDSHINVIGFFHFWTQLPITKKMKSTKIVKGYKLKEPAHLHVNVFISYSFANACICSSQYYRESSEPKWRVREFDVFSWSLEGSLDRRSFWECNWWLITNFLLFNGDHCFLAWHCYFDTSLLTTDLVFNIAIIKC